MSDSPKIDNQATNPEDKKDEPNFIKKDEVSEQKEGEELENNMHKMLEEVSQEANEVAQNLKNNIFPKNNQQRNLDRETGGLEAEEDKGISEKDVWDDRSEEVDRMGSTDTFNTTGMRSVLHRKKQEKKRAKKHAEQAKDALEAAEMADPQKRSLSSAGQSNSSFDNMSFTARVQNMRQDNDRGGGGIGM